MRSAARIALLVGRRMCTGTSAAASRWATDCRQVKATVISSRRHSRSWKAASVAALAASSRTCTRSAGRPLGERVLDVTAAQHVHADPAEILAPVPAGPEHGGIQGAAGQRHVGGGHPEGPGPPRVLVGNLAGEQAGVDPGPEAQHLVGGLLLAAVRGRDEPPGRCGRRPVGGGHDPAPACPAPLLSMPGWVPDSMIRSTRSCGPTTPMVSSPAGWRWPVIAARHPRPAPLDAACRIQAHGIGHWPVGPLVTKVLPAAGYGGEKSQ